MLRGDKDSEAKTKKEALQNQEQSLKPLQPELSVM